MQKPKYVLKYALFAFLFAASPVLASDIPATILLQEKAECKQECTLNGNNEMICETLCRCTVDQFSKLNLAEFQAMKAQLEAENVSAAMQSYLADIGAVCVAELDRVVEGLPKPPLP